MPLETSNVFRSTDPQDSFRNLKTVKSLGTSLVWWAHNLLDINKIRDTIAQTYRHTQRLMDNAWSEMILCCLCFVFYCFSSFHWFIQIIWDNSYPSLDYHYSLIHSHAPSIIFLLTTSNLMLYLCNLGFEPLFSISFKSL